MNTYWPWITLILLGAYHGINPAMGWLFAVGLGLQEQSRRAVLRAFAPIALGHALAIAGVVALIGAAQTVIDANWLRIGAAVVLLAFAMYKLVVRNSHPRWVGMRIGFRDLTLWSFLMATAHGAGLMLIPVLFKLNGSEPAMAEHQAHSTHIAQASMFAPTAELTAVMLHTVAMFTVMAVIAVIVYEKLGLRLLRRAWFNLDLIWSGALLVAGAVTLVWV